MCDIIKAEKPADAETIDGVVRAAFAHHPGVADMVSAIRASHRYRPGLALVARIGSRVMGFVMVSGTDLVADDATRREVLTLTPLAVLPAVSR
jgi:predicted N-acetyltransferase YhbS